MIERNNEILSDKLDNKSYTQASMTPVLTHTVTHYTKHSFRPKTNNQLLKKFLSLAVLSFKVNVKNYPNLSNFFFIEEYDFKGTLFVIGIFWKLHFLKHFIF